MNVENGKSESLRILIVGGVAGGASAAARARRLDENATIVVFERGKEASFANCGLPYYLGGEIAERGSLLVAGDRELKQWLNLDVRTGSEVISVDREAREVEVRELESGRTYRESYDYLILSTGAAPIRPGALLEKVGVNHPRVLSLRNMNDVDRIKSAVDAGIRSAIVIGGGFIGLEVAEQLIHRSIPTSLVEMLPQVMPPFDAEMVEPLHDQLASHGVDLHLDDGVAAIEPVGEQILVKLQSGQELPTDLVMMAIGVRPESDLAKDCGLDLTDREAIRVDAGHETNDPRIFAVGDTVEVTEPIFGGSAFVPLGGPANRQGRLVADRIATREGSQLFDGEELNYRGSQGTSIVRVFDLAAGMTGMSEKALTRMQKKRGEDFDVVFAHPSNHAGYYPGATPITIKLIYEKPLGRVLGAQAVGRDGVDKRIDVLAMAIQMKATVFDLEETELCYAPPFGSAKDPVNMVGFMAANALRGLTRPVHAADVNTDGSAEDVVILDVRTAPEFEIGAIPGAMHLPLENLRTRISEVPQNKTLVTYCKVGKRGYFAERILRQQGFKDVRNLSGGYTTWKQFHPSPRDTEQLSPSVPKPHSQHPEEVSSPSEETTTLDARGIQCPGPLMKLAEGMAKVASGEQLRVLASDPGFPKDVAAWCQSRGHTLVEAGADNGHFSALVRAGTAGSASTTKAGAIAEKGQTIVVFSGDLDRVLASFVIANGAAAMGHPVTMFFTFWGLNVLRADRAPDLEKGVVDRMFGMMMPRGPKKLQLSQMNFGGLGSTMMKKVMDEKGVSSLPQLIEDAKRQGVRLIACTMSMEIMGIRAEELIDGLDYAGVGAYIGAAENAKMNLFI